MSAFRICGCCFMAPSLAQRPQDALKATSTASGNRAGTAFPRVSPGNDFDEVQGNAEPAELAREADPIPAPVRGVRERGYPRSRHTKYYLTFVGSEIASLSVGNASRWSTIVAIALNVTLPSAASSPVNV